MKLLFISNIPPYELGGAEIQARKIAVEFLRHGHQVTVIGNRIPSGKVIAEGVEIHTINIPVLDFNRFTRAISYIVSLSVIFLWRYREYDLVYCRFVREAAITISLLKRILHIKLPLVACAACVGEYGDSRFLTALPFSRLMINTINRGCNRINNISPATASDLINIGVNPLIMTYIPNGISIPESKQFRMFGGECRRFVYVGRLHKQKGLEYLLFAIKNVIESGVAVSIEILGNGPERESLKNLVREYNIDKAVHFLGYVPNHEIIQHLRPADIFVMSSLCEGFATVVIEAMSVGLPVVVTKCGGPEYFVDDSVGRVCRPACSESLEKAMVELIDMNKNQLVEMGRRGRQRVIDRFGIESVYEQYFTLFTSLCAKPVV